MHALIEAFLIFQKSSLEGKLKDSAEKAKDLQKLEENHKKANLQVEHYKEVLEETVSSLDF